MINSGEKSTTTEIFNGNIVRGTCTANDSKHLDQQKYAHTDIVVLKFETIFHSFKMYN